MPSFVVNLLISFVMKQLHQFEAKIDWAKVQADIEVRIKTILPAPLCAAADQLIGLVISALKAALSDESSLKQLMTLIAGEKWADAIALIEKILFANRAVVAALDFNPTDNLA